MSQARVGSERSIRSFLGQPKRVLTQIISGQFVFCEGASSSLCQVGSSRAAKLAKQEREFWVQYLGSKLEEHEKKSAWDMGAEQVGPILIYCPEVGANSSSAVVGSSPCSMPASC